MVGMSLALVLARAGLSVALLEKGSLPAQLEQSFDGRVSAISLGSTHILEKAGAWAGMLPHAQPIQDIRVSDGPTPFFLHYDHREVGDEPFGYIIENRYIRRALQDAITQHPNLKLLEKCSISAQTADESGISITLNDGSTLRAQLLVGAEGRHSAVRDMAGIGLTQWEYKQTAIVCTIAHDKPHHGLAQERFLAAGPFAVLPMTQGRSSLVWVEPTERAGLYMELPDEEFVQEITERVGDYLGTLSLCSERFTYPLSLLHAKHYTAARVALVGDAAHGMHPIAGQGVNLGFRDVDDLAGMLVEQHVIGRDLGNEALLARYGRLRRLDNVTMLAVTDGLNRLFSTDLLPVQLARDLGLWAVGKMPGIKRILMRHAMGL